MKYTIKIYLNGIHWDNSYADNEAEAESIKSYIEDESRSVWDRVNEGVLIDFVELYNVQCVERIKVTTEIIED